MIQCSLIYVFFQSHTQIVEPSITPPHLWVHLSGNRAPTTNKFGPCSWQTMSICIQQHWNAIVWTSHAVGWPHWRKQGDCDQLPDRRGSLRVSGTSTPTKADRKFPIDSISAAEQNTHFQREITFDLFNWLEKKKKNKVAIFGSKKAIGLDVNEVEPSTFCPI